MISIERVARSFAFSRDVVLFAAKQRSAKSVSSQSLSAMNSTVGAAWRGERLIGGEGLVRLYPACRPDSVLVRPAQRPARSLWLPETGLVQRQQPMVG